MRCPLTADLSHQLTRLCSLLLFSSIILSSDLPLSPVIASDGAGLVLLAWATYVGYSTSTIDLAAKYENSFLWSKAGSFVYISGLGCSRPRLVHTSMSPTHSRGGMTRPPLIEHSVKEKVSLIIFDLTWMSEFAILIFV